MQHVKAAANRRNHSQNLSVHCGKAGLLCVEVLGLVLPFGEKSEIRSVGVVKLDYHLTAWSPCLYSQIRVFSACSYIFAVHANTITTFSIECLTLLSSCCLQHELDVLLVLPRHVHSLALRSLSSKCRKLLAASPRSCPNWLNSDSASSWSRRCRSWLTCCILISATSYSFFDPWCT